MPTAAEYYVARTTPEGIVAYKIDIVDGLNFLAEQLGYGNGAALLRCMGLRFADIKGRGVTFRGGKVFYLD